MSHELISRNADLKRLLDEGYEIEIKEAHLLVHSVPYFNAKQEVMYGTLVSPLTLSGDKTVPPASHVAFFAGEYPCDKLGVRLSPIKHESKTQLLATGIEVHHSFSNKSKERNYLDHFEKMSRYIEIISAPVQSIHPKISAKTSRPVLSNSIDSVFRYIDTNASKAGIGALSEKFRGQKVGIIGIGGTGSYVFDLVAKTPVLEIHIFDGDEFVSHNAFRAPGAASVEQLNELPKKVTYFSEIYSAIRKGIIPHAEHVTSANLTKLDGLDFVFICIDKGAPKAEIIPYLESKGIPFIDVGIGVLFQDDKLQGTVRVTSSTKSKRDHVRTHVSFSDGPDDEYNQNIQIAELNSLNAALAVIKWKKLLGFYLDLEKEHHSTYVLDGNATFGRDNET